MNGIERKEEKLQEEITLTDLKINPLFLFDKLNNSKYNYNNNKKRRSICLIKWVT